VSVIAGRDELVVAHGVSLLLAVVRVWDHVCAAVIGKMAFRGGKRGKRFLVFGFGEVRAWARDEAFGRGPHAVRLKGCGVFWRRARRSA
jgi:hypothetical protein